MTETSTATTALIELEQSIIDGADVTAAELAEARAAVDVEKLTEVGNQNRRARRAAEEAAEVREQGKVDAAALMAEHSSAGVLAAFDQARAAFDNMLMVIGEHNAAIDQAEWVLSRAGVPGRSTDPTAETPEHCDTRNVAYTFQGTTTRVVVDGEQYTRQNAASWAAVLAHQVASAHRLELNGGRELASLIGERGHERNADLLLREHLAA